MSFAYLLGRPPPAFFSVVAAFAPPTVFVTGNGTVRNGPGLYGGFRVAAPVAGTVSIYNGPNATLGDLVHSVVNPAAGTWYYPPGVDPDNVATWVSCIGVYVTQPTQIAEFKLDD